jgi:drug/metabolite transporter (DMT)-like permease
VFITGLLVLGRIAAASWSNVLQKRAINDPQILGERPTALEMLLAIWTLMVLVLSPWWAHAVWQSLAGPSLHQSGDTTTWLAFWGWMTLACALEMPGNLLLLRSIQRTDLSIFGPLSSYKPIVGMLLGWWILAEVPTVFGVIGTSIVLAGSLLLTDRPRNGKKTDGTKLGVRNPGVRDRLLAVALTAAGSIFLKLAMQHQDALTCLSAWSLMSWLMALAWLGSDVLVSRRSPTATPRFIRIACQSRVLSIAVSMIAMQWLTIAVFQVLHVGYALALFQLGSLVSVYLGHRLFGEVDFWRRMLAASIMFVGASLIVLAG